MGSTSESEDKVGPCSPSDTVFVTIRVALFCFTVTLAVLRSRTYAIYRSSRICRRKSTQRCWRVKCGPLRRENASIMRMPTEDSLIWSVLDTPCGLHCTGTQLTGGIGGDQLNTTMYDILNKSPQCCQYPEELPCQDI